MAASRTRAHSAVQNKQPPAILPFQVLFEVGEQLELALCKPFLAQAA